MGAPNFDPESEECKQYSTVQYSTVQQHRWVDTSTVPTVLYSTVQYSTVQWVAIVASNISDLLSPQQAAVCPGRVRAGGRGRGRRPAEDGQEQGGD